MYNLSVTETQDDQSMNTDLTLTGDRAVREVAGPGEDA